MRHFFAHCLSTCVTNIKIPTDFAYGAKLSGLKNMGLVAE